MYVIPRSVILVLGGLYTFFSAATAILMSKLGLTAFQLRLSFATTILIVFAAGFLAPPWLTAGFSVPLA